MKKPVCAIACFVLLAAMPADAQVSVGDRQVLAFERPESWAMAHAAAGTLFLGSGPPQSGQPFHLTIAAEFASVPHIERSKTRVGFNGTKLEDLNKSPVFGRARLSMGLPLGFTAELAYSPPVTIDGVRPDGIYGLALERPLIDRDSWTAGLRIYGQAAQVRGSITCSSDIFDLGVFHPERNPFGCVAPSDDLAELDHYGLEIAVGRRAEGHRRWLPFAAFAASRLDAKVQVNADRGFVIDRSIRATEGTLRTITVGTVFRWDESWRWTVAASYTPLDVERPPDFQRRDDDFWSFRLIGSLAL